MNQLIVLFILGFYSLGIMGATKSPDYKELQDDLANIRNQTTGLVAQMRSVEQKLGQKNNLYISKVQNSQKLQDSAKEISGKLRDNLKAINEEESVFNNVKRQLVLETLDEEDEHAYLNSMTLQNAMKIKSGQLNELKLENKEITKIFSTIEKDLQQTSAEEESLQALILDLEREKSDLSQKYITNVELQNTRQEKLDKLTVIRKAKKKVYSNKFKSFKDLNFKLITPIAKYKTFKEKEQAITFKYDSVEPIRAVASGKVEYAKELSSYGKVIIIDHGNQVRSIILGDLSVKTEKGLIVKQGDLIGYTQAEPGMKKSLHFEIRKNNKVQRALTALNLKQNNNTKI